MDLIYEGDDNRGLYQVKGLNFLGLYIKIYAADILTSKGFTNENYTKFRGLSP
jgi:hypothetical protein